MTSFWRSEDAIIPSCTRWEKWHQARMSLRQRVNIVHSFYESFVAHLQWPIMMPVPDHGRLLVCTQQPTMVGHWTPPGRCPAPMIGWRTSCGKHISVVTAWTVRGTAKCSKIKDAQSHNVSFGVYSLTLWPLFPKIERNEKKWSATWVFTIYIQINHQIKWYKHIILYSNRLCNNLQLLTKYMYSKKS